MKKFEDLILLGPSIVLTPTPLTTKATQVKSIGYINMNQTLKITTFDWPH